MTIPDELRALTESLRTYVEREILPIEDERREELSAVGTLHDLTEVRRELRRKSVKHGFYQLFMPEELGGGGVGYLGLVLCHETVSATGSFLAPNGGVLPSVEGPSLVLLDCTDDQRSRYLYPTMNAEREAAFALTEPDAGSDARRIRTSAVRHGDRFVINGRKHLITHGAYADYVIVFAVTDPDKGGDGGITAFLVDTATPGFSVARRQRTMYDDHQAELVFEDLEVGEEQVLGREGYGFLTAMRWINGGRLQIAANAVGIADHLVRRMVDYARTRETFGQRIGSFQYVQGMVVDSLCELEQARYLVYAAAEELERGRDERTAAAKAKYVATEMVNRVVDRAIQVHGGNGYMTELGIERYARYVRGMRLYEGTSEILKTNIAKGLGL
jgi:alkylation response protein AidB-like acyl-CoA dehydrogenase